MGAKSGTMRTAAAAGAVLFKLGALMASVCRGRSFRAIDEGRGGELQRRSRDGLRELFDESVDRSVARLL